MDNNIYANLTDEALLAEKKKLKRSRTFYALAIGFMAGVLIFGLISWLLVPGKKPGFLLPMLIPVFIIYKILKSPDKGKQLAEVLKERNLS